LRPGDTVIVSSEAGGHDLWGWTGKPGLVPDVADIVSRRNPLVRLRPGVVASLIGADPPGLAETLAGGRDRPLRELADALLGLALSAIRSSPDDELAPAARRWAEQADRLRARLSDPRTRVLRPGGPEELATIGLVVSLRSRDALDEEGDTGEASSSLAARPIPLAAHLSSVTGQARGLAERIGLPSDLVHLVELAGRLHDLGKLERRFQVMLHRGDPDRFEASGVPLAKSGMDPSDRAALRRARELAGLPPGWRHEALSGLLARTLLSRGLVDRDSVDTDLLIHLVQTHHGRCRPLFAPGANGSLAGWDVDLREVIPGVEASLEELLPSSLSFDWEGPARFARLCRRYGRWGLALLETALRLADIAVSEQAGIAESEEA
ncbi:MAG: CRISPR-associated endonuclease Cas3'', partial [Thermoleophilia bacterium]